MSGTSPTLRQRELGLRLRKLRTGLGLTVEDVADKLLCSPAKISRIETAARRAAPRDVRDLCALYGVNEVGTAELMQLAREARQQGWWTQYDDLNLYPYIGLEQDASSITCYSTIYVPALLQTEEYARAIIKAVLPKIAPKVLQDRVEVRLRRQQLFDRDDPPRYRAVIDEGVLRRPVGGTELMAAQLDRIFELVNTDKATVQVIPFEVGAYAVSDSNFVFLEFSESPQSPIVYVEGLASGQYYERPADVDLYRESVESLRDSALSPRNSVQFLETMREAYINK
jgi:transcriptional regulator with XRE-family HTH domain